MTPNTDYWVHVSAAFIGAGVAVALVAITTAAYIRWRNVQDEREDERARERERKTRASRERPTMLGADEPIDEGRMRVAVRRSREIPFHDPNDAPDSGLSGRKLFEKRQGQADAAALRRGEATQPVAVLLCEPPMVDGLTLFAYLRHHAPQPSGLAWDSENMGALANVTQALYEGVQNDRNVAPVFEPYDLDELRRHFVRTLVVLTSKGLDVQSADTLGRAHAHLRIRPEQYDAVIGHFVQALKTFLPPPVFEGVLPQLSPAVQALRMRIVTATGAA